MSRILLIQGHPDGTATHLCHALGAAYREGAEASGHKVRELCVAGLNLPWLHTKDEFESAPDNPVLQAAQDDLQWANRVVIVFPLWLGEMPAMLKGFLEQVCRPRTGAQAGMNHLGRLLQGKSARIIVTMGMPALLYRLFFFAHGNHTTEIHSEFT